MGKTLDRFLPLQLRAAHHEHIRKFGDAGVTIRSMTSPSILSAVRADGEQFPIEATISQVQVEGQKLYTVILRDITERKLAEETLRQSEARFRSIYEQAAVGIEQVALDGKLLMVNARAVPDAGLRRERTAWQNRQGHHPSRGSSASSRSDRNALQREHRRSYEIEKRDLHRDVSVVWVDVTSSMVHGPAGQPL